MRGDKEGGVPSIRAARRDGSERGGGMGSKGPRASERARERAFPMCRNITLGFPGKRDYGTAINRAQRREEETNGWGAMMAMSGGGGHDRR